MDDTNGLLRPVVLSQARRFAAALPGSAAAGAIRRNRILSALINAYTINAPFGA